MGGKGAFFLVNIILFTDLDRREFFEKALSASYRACWTERDEESVYCDDMYDTYETCTTCQPFLSLVTGLWAHPRKPWPLLRWLWYSST